MEVEGNLAIVLIKGETNAEYDGDPTNLERETNAGYGTDPINLEQEHNTGYATDTVDKEIYRGFNMYTSYPTHEAHPTQEGPSHQGPPEWFLEYFGRLDKSLGEIKLQQADIIQNQK